MANWADFLQRSKDLFFNSVNAVCGCDLTTDFGLIQVIWKLQNSSSQISVRWPLHIRRIS